MNAAFFEENTMRKDDLLRMIDAIHRERGVELDILFEALEEALSMAARKRVGVEEGYDVKINRRNGEIALKGLEIPEDGALQFDFEVETPQPRASHSGGEPRSILGVGENMVRGIDSLPPERLLIPGQSEESKKGKRGPAPAARFSAHDRQR